MGAAVLGLSLADRQQHALARAAIVDPAGEIRHTAALGLAALGLQAVADSELILNSAASVGKTWHYPQALAQMKAAGFPMPDLSLRRQWQVRLWSTAITAWDNRWPMLIESAYAGVGTGFALGLCQLVLALGQPHLQDSISFLVLSVYLQPLGIIVGMLAVVMTWLLSVPNRPRSGWRHVAGVSSGFALGVIGVWLPLALASLYARNAGLDRVQNALLQHIVGGALWGTGIALGAEIAGRFKPHSMVWCAIASGMGGVLGCLVAVAIGVGIPFVDPEERLQIQIAQATLFAFTTGAGFAGGWELGKRIWRQFQPK